ncbi:MAG TPA: SMC-Scp complex subunit ScpB [Micavibrio sp.]|nr:SMC-Scp complex subunit ScpB [Pseudomonadota bacterium]MEC8663970.1 SMC-Scp complex subunit ScpB [Pseudomonadota bacterium]HIF25889.1 SMC-Scp complex subunit ScpB [Micavibrio sp.]HIL29637.1 SMC-Scp complex subunit ScpB [Micavibrio sp.]
MDKDLRVIEALLFASSEPLTTNTIRERVGDDSVDVGGLLMELQKHYEGRGVNLIEIEGSWAFRTATDLGDVLQITKEVQRKLSRAAMETLAIVAYHQPVTRAEIENIRGVATHKGTLDVLMEAEWVKPGRRRETPGRPLTWVTTTSFLDHFGLEALTELPGLDEMKASGLLDRRPAIETVPGTGELFEQDDLDEIEMELAREDDEAQDEEQILPDYEPDESDVEEDELKEEVA